jgi:hypothetical protein
VFVVHVIPPLKLITKRSPDGMLFLAVFPVTDSFNVDSVNWHGSTKVNINIPASVASNPSFQVDGSELVDNLQMVTPNRSNLDTVTTIQVHLLLAHPTDCLKAYSFITNNDNTAQIGSIQVSKKVNNARFRVTSEPSLHCRGNKHLQCCPVC